MIRIPRPETRFAFLMNEAIGMPTRHRYVETIEAMLPMLPGNEEGLPVGGSAWQFLYECEVTGMQRVWGVEERAVSTFDQYDPPSA
jgi:hypothetical protein